MADAVLNITHVKGTESEYGRVRERIVDLTFSGAGADTYVVGGFTVSPDSLGLLSVIGAKPMGQATVSGAAKTAEFYPDYDFKTGKLQLFTSNGAAPAKLAEATAAITITTDLGAIQIRMAFIGF